MLLFHNGFEIVKMFFELVPKQICCHSNTFKKEKEEMGSSEWKQEELIISRIK